MTRIYEKFVKTKEDEKGVLQEISFLNTRTSTLHTMWWISLQ